MSEPSLPKRRTDYQSIAGEQEYFAGPLLAAELTRLLDAYAPPTHSERRVLDVGAGECPLKAVLTARGYSYRSLDVRQNSVGTIDFLTRIDESLPPQVFVQGKYDVILCTEVLEHVPDWRTAFANLHELLNPGGVCIITAPFFYMPHEEPYDFWRPTEHALRETAQKSRLSVLEYARFGEGWDVLGTLICSTAICRKRKNVIGAIIATAVWCVHRALKAALQLRLFQSHVELQTRFYVGNVLVVTKGETNGDEEAFELNGIRQLSR